MPSQRHVEGGHAPTLQQKRIDDFLSWSREQSSPIEPPAILSEWDTTSSTSRLDLLIQAFVALDRGTDPLLQVVREARRIKRRRLAEHRGPVVDTSAPHWQIVPFPARSEELAKARLEKADNFLLWRHSLKTSPTLHQILTEWDLSETEQPLRLLHGTLLLLLGESHELCQSVLLASNIRCSEHRKKRRGQPKKVSETREDILQKAHWDKLRENPIAQTMPIDRLRLTDRFFCFCTERQLRDIDEGHVKEFLPTQAPSRFWELRVAMEELFGLRHPIGHVVEAARKSRWQEYALQKRIIGRETPRQGTQLQVSVPRSDLPDEWLLIFDRLERGEAVRGYRLSAATVKGMCQAARELIFAARKVGMLDELSIETVRACDASFDERNLRASSRVVHTLNLWRLARALGALEVQGALHELHGYYHRRSKGEQTEMNTRYAALPSLADVFDRAYELKELGQQEPNTMSRTTLLVDAAAIAFLSLIPLRNADTVIRWGVHIAFDEHASDDWKYRIDTKITKPGAAFGSALHPILYPFLEAVLLQGQDVRFLPRVRRQAIEDRIPVFPTSTGKARNLTGLSSRWRATFGVGSHTARAQVHTTLGLMGPSGVEAALALCAQRDPRTRAYYQAEALKARQVRVGQKQLLAALPRNLVEDRVKAFQLAQKAVGAS